MGITVLNLSELAEELTGTLRVLAYTEHSGNLKFIKKRQNYFGQKYGRMISEDVIAMSGEESAEEIAYSRFMNILEGNPRRSEIASKCEEILMDIKDLPCSPK